MPFIEVTSKLAPLRCCIVTIVLQAGSSKGFHSPEESVAAAVNVGAGRTEEDNRTRRDPKNFLTHVGRRAPWT